MIIQMLQREIILEPIGMNIIGAAGRVDLKGANGIVKLLLVSKSAASVRFVAIENDEKERSPFLQETKAADHKLVWKIATPAPNVRFIELNGDCFAEALMKVL